MARKTGALDHLVENVEIKKNPIGEKGNKYGLKLKDPDIRQLAYEDYLNHLSKGKSKRSWYFEHENLTCTWETIEKYAKDVSEFDPRKKDVAEAKGLAKWEQVVEDSAEGKNKDASTATLQMLMRNKYGWDKENNQSQIDGSISRSFELVMKQIDISLKPKEKQIETIEEKDERPLMQSK